MNKLGVKGKAWLKGFHLFFCSAWIGTGLSMLVLSMVKGFIPNGDELYAVNACIKLLDDYIIIPAALGSLITGLLFSLFTNWGFFKFYWVIFKWIATVAQIIFGTFWLGPWTNGATAITKIERAQSLYNAQYLYFREMNNYFGGIQVLLLIIVVFISVFKPWGKRV